MQKALFLDRDGVINIDSGYVSKKEEFIFCDGVFSALRYFQDKGYLLFVITNQSGIGRGYYSEEDFISLSAWMCEELKKQGIKISKIYHCPHAPELKCECRKPKPKMILQACAEFNIDLQQSIMIGDKLSDVEAGASAGIEKLFLIGEEKGNFYENVQSLAYLPSKLKGDKC